MFIKVKRIIIYILFFICTILYADIQKAQASNPPVLDLYTEGGSGIYYGAVNEPENGVLYGACSNANIRKYINNESMVLTYQELGQTLISYNKTIVADAARKGIAVEFALNCPKEGEDIRNIQNLTSYLKEISDLFNKYPNTKFYLRFAAEFDIWENPVDSESFKTAFRLVSKYFKDRRSNVAIVWSPNQVSNAKIKIDDYYPGDEYVDWVGMSSYAVKYFLADKSQKAEYVRDFKAGDYSEPVSAISDIVSNYGNRKPIMLSEMGCSHYVYSENEDTTEFALQRLKEYYSYVPMVYPQVKLMAYFDIHLPVEKNDFRLQDGVLKDEFLDLVSGARFIQGGNQSTDFCYRKIENNSYLNSTFSVSAYVRDYGKRIDKVAYYLDDKYIGMSSELPFTVYVDASDYASGKHTLKAVASGNSVYIVREKSVNISNDKKNITVNIDGTPLEFDQNPVIFNDRTLVPMRAIFEDLGANVSWNDVTKTATGVRGDKTIKLQVGNGKMYVNNTEFKLDISPIIVSSRTLVPVRAVAESLSCDVDWDEYNSRVNIHQRSRDWSDWMEKTPSSVTEDLYYIDEKTQYSYYPKIYFKKEGKNYSVIGNRKVIFNNYVSTETTYGEWGDWQDNPISEDDTTEVQTRTVSRPVNYHYGHYCTGYTGDPDTSYKTSSVKWSDIATYHDLGWYNYILPYSEDSNSDYICIIDGEKYRCSNSCWRWYIDDTSEKDYTQYRSRKVTNIHTFWEYGDRVGYGDDYPPADAEMISERTVYRYMEK